jgi:signal transduction histidine kinase
MWTKDTLLKWTHLGVGSDTEPSDAKYIILTNTVTLAALALCLLYLVTNRALGQGVWVQLGPPILSGAAFAVPLWLNHIRRHWLATTFMCFAGLIIQIMFVITFGYTAGNHYFLLPLLSGAPLLFPPRYWKTAALAAGVGLATFVTIVVQRDRVQALMEMPPEAPARYYTLALCASAVLVIFISFYAHRRMAIAESQLEARSRELRTALEDLKATQAKMIEAANHAILGRLTAGLLHEVNTPLGSIRSAADTIQTALTKCRVFVAKHPHSSDENLREVRRAIDVSSDVRNTLDTATERIATLVSALRRFVGLDEAEQKYYDVCETIDSALELVAPFLSDSTRVVRSYPDEMPRIIGSPAKLNRAVFSVLHNSAQALGDGGTIQVNLRSLASSLEIELADDGRGIPRDVIPGVFELNLDRKGDRVGMRLGLPMSKRIVEEMGGRFSLESVEGVGTTVRITLPLPPLPAS